MLMKHKASLQQQSAKTKVMGILNITPDSFSDGGKYNEIDKAIQRAIEMEEQGAHIIDIGAESTRPNHKPISADEEIERVTPIVEQMKNYISLPISIDTYKSQTAEAAVQVGAQMINDIWGAKKDSQMANVAATYDVPIILMHNRNNTNYTNIVQDVIGDLEASVAIAKKAGVKDENIIIDPGIGFAKTLEQNYVVLNELEKIVHAFSYPLLLGTSRKSFITKVLDIPAEERDNATGATTCFGVMKGAQFVRVHDVQRTVELVKMMEAMMEGVPSYG